MRPIVLVAALALAGCASDAERPGADGGSASSSSQLVTPRDLEGLYADVVRELVREVAAQDARGWPPHVARSADPPGRPRVRVGPMINDTTTPADPRALQGEVEEALVEQGLLEVAGDPRDRPGGEPGPGDEGALLVRGVLEKEDGALVLTLHLLDTRQAKVLTTAKAALRR